MVKDGKLYARYDFYTIKRGKKKQRVLPEGAVPCQDMEYYSLNVMLLEVFSNSFECSWYIFQYNATVID